MIVSSKEFRQLKNGKMNPLLSKIFFFCIFLLVYNLMKIGHFQKKSGMAFLKMKRKEKKKRKTTKNTIPLYSGTVTLLIYLKWVYLHDEALDIC